jgi:hypothetical protein
MKQPQSALRLAFSVPALDASVEPTLFSVLDSPARGCHSQVKLENWIGRSVQCLSLCLGVPTMIAGQPDRFAFDFEIDQPRQED